MWLIIPLFCVLILGGICIYDEKKRDLQQTNPDTKNKENLESFQQFLSRNNLNTDIVIGDPENPYLVVDRGNKVFVVNKKIFKFSELVDYKLSVKYSQKSQSNASKRAVTGGLLFGSEGAIVGAATAKTKSYEVCDDISIKLFLDNAQNLSEEIYFSFSFTSLVLKSESMMKSETPALLKYAEECAAALEIIKKENQKQEPAAKEDKNSIVYKLERISELYQQGTITEAEFNKLKEGLIDGKW